MGCRENVRMAQPMPQARQGLRGHHHKRRCLDSHRPYPPPYQTNRKDLKVIRFFMSQTLIQHYGLIGVGEVIQHFTETWSLLQDGRWRQDVGPSRYTCISERRMGQLLGSSPGAAKPTRDQRQAYDLLNRVSTIQITPKGWVQSEMNDKVTKEGKVVATEAGWVEYRRTADDSPCDGAIPQRVKANSPAEGRWAS